MVNGVVVPYNRPIEVLQEMMLTDNMGEFAAVCEALSYHSDPRAYELLRCYAAHKDKYVRLCILKTVFRHPRAVELNDFLTDALQSDDIFFVENALRVIPENRLEVPNGVLLRVVRKHLQILHYNALYALQGVDDSEENYEAIVELLQMATSCGQKEVLSTILCNKYLEGKSAQLFRIFSTDSCSKLRVLAVKIATKYGFDLSLLCHDVDGHVRNAVFVQAQEKRKDDIS